MAVLSTNMYIVIFVLIAIGLLIFIPATAFICVRQRKRRSSLPTDSGSDGYIEAQPYAEHHKRTSRSDSAAESHGDGEGIPSRPPPAYSAAHHKRDLGPPQRRDANPDSMLNV